MSPSTILKTAIVENGSICRRHWMILESCYITTHKTLLSFWHDVLWKISLGSDWVFVRCCIFVYSLVLPFQLCWSLWSACDVCRVCSPDAMEMEGTDQAGRRGAGSLRERCCRTWIMASFSSNWACKSLILWHAEQFLISGTKLSVISLFLQLCACLLAFVIWLKWHYMSFSI